MSQAVPRGVSSDRRNCQAGVPEGAEIDQSPHPEAPAKRASKDVPADNEAPFETPRFARLLTARVAEGGLGVTDRRVFVWIALGFCANLALTGVAVIALQREFKAIQVALLTSARVTFLFFWPAYAGSALVSLFGDRFSFLRRHAREFGLSFAGALSLHLGAVAWLCLAGHPPNASTFVIFGVAAVLAYLLALFSVARVREAMPATVWTFLRTFGVNYIALAFLLDFKRRSFSDAGEVLIYVPFAALIVAGILMKLAVWAQKRRESFLRRLAAH